MTIFQVGFGPTVVGPGYTFALRTDISGPLPSDWFWEVRLFPHGDELNGPVGATQALSTSDQHQVRIKLGPNTSSGFGSFYSTQLGFSTNQLIDATYTLWNATQTVVEDSGGDTGWTWDTNSSMQLLEPTASAALDSEQAAQLAETHNLVAPPFTTSAGVALPIDIGDLVKRPALKLLGIDDTVYTLTGQGTLSVPYLLGFPTAWGIVLDVTSAPSGWGRKPGYVDSFNYRIGQFLALMPAANGAGSMVMDEFRLHLEHRTWVWADAWITDIAYFIDPPCEVQARFLTAFTP